MNELVPPPYPVYFIISPSSFGLPWFGFVASFPSFHRSAGLLSALSAAPPAPLRPMLGGRQSPLQGIDVGLLFVLYLLVVLDCNVVDITVLTKMKRRYRC
jgi:hypothetical protein